MVIMREAMMTMCDARDDADFGPGPAFQPGRIGLGTTLVLAAPGLDEARAGHPAAGRTGEHLDILLGHAHRADPEIFPSPSRFDYRIVNAVSEILSGRKTLPTVEDIKKPGNLARLGRQLEGDRVYVAFGDQACRAVHEAGLLPTFYTGHPGMKGLNQLPVNGSSEVGTLQRLRLLAQILIDFRGRPEDAKAELRRIRQLERIRRKSP